MEDLDFKYKDLQKKELERKIQEEVNCYDEVVDNFYLNNNNNKKKKKKKKKENGYKEEEGVADGMCDGQCNSEKLGEAMLLKISLWKDVLGSISQ